MNDCKRPAERIHDGEGDGSEGMKSKKRARFQEEEEEEEEEQTPTEMTNFIPTLAKARGHRFLRLHLQLLKAMYFEDRGSFENINGTNGTKTGNGTAVRTAEHDDGPMDEKLCQRIEHLLRDRGRLGRLDATVQHYKGLYNDAVDFMEQEDDKHGSNGGMSMSPWSMISPAAAATTANGGLPRGGAFMYGSGNSFLFGTSQQSPFAPMSRIFPHGLLLSSSRNQDCSDVNAGPPNAFGIVAGLLHAKYGNAVDALQQTTNPFGSLASEVAKRVERLEQLATSGHPRGEPFKGEASVDYNDEDGKVNTRGEKSTSLSGGETFNSNRSEEDEEWQARIETKLHLWKMLYSDLVE